MAKDKKKKKMTSNRGRIRKKCRKRYQEPALRRRVLIQTENPKRNGNIYQEKKKKRRYKTKKKKTTSARSSSPTDQYAGRRGMKTSRPFEASIAVNGFVGIVLKNHGEILMKVKRSPTSNPWNAISCKGWNNSPKRLIE